MCTVLQQCDVVNCQLFCVVELFANNLGLRIFRFSHLNTLFTHSNQYTPTWRRGSMPSSITSVHLMYICEAGVRKCVWKCEFLFQWVQGRLHPLPSTPPCVAISVPSGATQASNGTYGVMHSHGDNDLMLFCVWNIFTVAISFRWCRVCSCSLRCWWTQCGADVDQKVLSHATD